MESAGMYSYFNPNSPADNSQAPLDLSSFLPEASAPPMEEENLPVKEEKNLPVKEEKLSIKWKGGLPEARPLTLLEDTKSRETAKTGAYALGALSAGLSFLSSKFLAASAVTIVTCTGGFGIVAVAAVATGVYLSTMETHELDPDLRSEKRATLAQKIEENQAIPPYAILLGNKNAKIITEEEVQELLRKDILKLDFIAFENKHGSINQCQLSEANKQLLIPKFIESKKAEGLKSVLNSPKAKYLNINQGLATSFFIKDEIQLLHTKKILYNDFISRNGIDIIPDITDAHAHRILVANFQENVLAAMINKGDIQAKREFAKEFNVFGRAIEEETLALVAWQTFSSQPKGAYDYHAIRKLVSQEQLKSYVARYMSINEEMRQAFLRMPYTQMIEYKDEMPFLEIINGDIKQRLEMNWNHQRIQDILKFDSINFFLSLKDTIFLPSDWTQKVLNDTNGLSIKDILILESRLITTKILHAQVILPSGISLCQALENEIQNYKSFEALFDDYKEVIFNEKLYLPKSPTLTALALDFIKRHAKECLHKNYDYKIENIVRIIEKNSLLSSVHLSLLRKARENVITLNQSNADEKENINKMYQRKIREAESQKDNLLLHAYHNSNLDQLTTTMNLALASKNQKESNLANKQKKAIEEKASLDQCTAEIDSLSAEIQSLNFKLSELEKNYNTDSMFFLERNIDQKKIYIRDLEYQLSKSLHNDVDLNQAINSIGNIEAQIEICKLSLDVSRLTSELKNVATEKLDLEKKIEDCQNERTKTQGFQNAWNALNNPLKDHQKALKSLTDKEAQLESKKKKLESMEKLHKSSSSLEKSTATLKTLEASLSLAETIYEQKKTKIESLFNLKGHQKELLGMELQLGDVRSAIRKKQDLNNTIMTLKTKISSNETNLFSLRRSVENANLTVRLAKLEAEEALKAYNLAEANCKRVKGNLESVKKVYEQTFLASKKALDAELSAKLEKAEKIHAEGVNRIEISLDESLI